MAPELIAAIVALSGALSAVAGILWKSQQDRIKGLEADCERKDAKIDELNKALLRAVQVTGKAVEKSVKETKGERGGAQ